MLKLEEIRAFLTERPLLTQRGLSLEISLVQSFDKLCDSIVTAIIRAAKEYQVEEETYYQTNNRAGGNSIITAAIQ